MATPSDFRPRGRYAIRSLPSGALGLAWEPPMPRLPDENLEVIFYLYPDTEAAEKAEQAGGCGFFLNWPFARDNQNHLYAVTNRHIIHDGHWTMRITNLLDGKSIIIDTDDSKWFPHPNGDDLSIFLVDFPMVFQCKASPPRALITHDVIAEHAIGIGDDVFTVGRFTNHDGKLRNNPSVRFGNIAQMPIEPILQRNGHLQESFLCECRSVSGYSGSPVYVDLPSWSARPNKEGIQSRPIGRWLLGVNWGHLNDWKPVCDALGNAVATGYQVGMNSGMMGVVPAWKLREMLEHPEMVERRRKREDDVLGKAPPISSFDSAPRKKGEVPIVPEPDNPAHKEDFTALLG